MKPRPVLAFLLPALLLLLPVRAAAQRVEGELIEQGTGKRVAGAVIVLLDGAGAQAGGTLTNAEGGFVLDVRLPGRYRLRGERIGYSNAQSEMFELAVGEVRQVQLVAPLQAVSLEGVTARVSGRKRCVADPQEQLRIGTVWEEARKALRATQVTQDEALAKVDVVRYTRQLDAEATRILEESARRRSGWTGNPFVSVPAEQLAREGFVRAPGGQLYADPTLWHAPDAAVLLSESFYGTHCFQLQAGEDGLIGLAFEPERSRKLPDISGVLWLDRSSAELRFLEYDYVNVGLDDVRPRPDVGGRIEFRRLPAGAWIVDRWWIQMPRLAEAGKVRRSAWSSRSVGNQELWVLAGYTQEGGEVIALSAEGGKTVYEADRATLSGLVYDSIRAEPLAGALVFLAGTQYSAKSDSEGRFTLADLPEGEYSLAFHHPRADSLSWQPPPQPVALVRGSETALELAIPPLPRVMAGGCGDARGGAVVGWVRNAYSQVPIAGARVRLTRPEGGGPPREAQTDGEGRYRICGVPPRTPLRLEVSAAEHQGEVIALELADAEPVRQDLEVRVVQTQARITGGRNAGWQAGTTEPRSRVAGQVVDAVTGEAVPGAVVQLDGMQFNRLTDERGRFTFPEVPHGERRLTVQHLAYGKHDQSLALGAGGVVDVEVRLAPRAIELEGVTATGRGYRERAALARGGVRQNLLLRDDLAAMEHRALHVGELVSGEFPSVRVFSYQGADGFEHLCIASERGQGSFRAGGQRGSSACPAPLLVIVDDIRLDDAADTLLRTQANSIESIEFIPASLAGALYGTGSAHGVLVIYTRGMGPHAGAGGSR